MTTPNCRPGSGSASACWSCRPSLLETQAALAFQATHDALTGIFNRRAILDRLDPGTGPGAAPGQQLERRHVRHRPFQEDQRHLGPPGRRRRADRLRPLFAGRVARIRLRRPLRRRGIPGHRHRLTRTKRRRALRTAARTGGRRRDQNQGRGDVSVTVSIGTAAGTGQSTVDRLLAAADAALYRAKAEGRNRVVRSSSKSSADYRRIRLDCPRRG